MTWVLGLGHWVDDNAFIKMGRNTSDLTAVEVVLEDMIQRTGREHQKMLETVAFRKDGQVLCAIRARLSGVFLKKPERPENWLTIFKTQEFKGKERQNYQGHQVYISLLIVGKNYLLTQLSYLQRSFMPSDIRITKIRDNTV